jgi:hypothetical protein
MTAEGAGEKYEIKVDVDEATLQGSLMRVRGLMFEVNSVRNLINDTTRMSQDPSLSNAFWLGMQAQMTARRVRALPETLTGFGAGVESGIAALGPYAIPATILAAATLTLLGLASYRMAQEKINQDWENRQQGMRKAQGLQP